MNRRAWLPYLMFRAMILAVPLGASVPERSLEPTASFVPSFESARVYPNPWRADRHTDVPITFDQMPSMTSVRIFTLAGHFVKTLDSDNSGEARWDLTTDSGERVASGIYLYVMATDDGQEARGQLAVIK